MKACTRCGSTTNGFNKHPTAADRLQWRCRKCQSELRKRYWLEHERGNTETNIKRKKRDQAYNERHPEKVKAAKALYVATHEEECKARILAWQKAHPEECKAWAKAWANSHPDQVKIINERYRRQHAELLRVRAHRHRADGEFFLEDILRLKEAQQEKCAACRVSLEDGYHIDHIIPVCKGGTNAATNIHLLCPDCNYHKQSMDYAVFLAKREAEFHELKEHGACVPEVEDPRVWRG